MAAEFIWELQGVHVVEHLDPLFLLGTDVMRSGRMTGWKFAGIRAVTERPGKVSSTMEFEKGEEHCSA